MFQIFVILFFFFALLRFWGVSLTLELGNEHKQLHNAYVIVSNSSGEKSKSLPVKSYSLDISFKTIKKFPPLLKPY
jgi:hypothetical protein